MSPLWPPSWHVHTEINQQSEDWTLPFRHCSVIVVAVLDTPSIEVAKWLRSWHLRNGKTSRMLAYIPVHQSSPGQAPEQGSCTSATAKMQVQLLILGMAYPQRRVLFPPLYYDFDCGLPQVGDATVQRMKANDNLCALTRFHATNQKSRLPV